VQVHRGGGAELVQRRGRGGVGAVVQRWCRGGEEVVLRCRFVQRCRGGSEHPAA